MPLTLRGDVRRTGARDRGVRRSPSRRDRVAGRDLRRAIHLRARRRRRRPRGRTSPVELSRVAERTAAEPGRLPGAPRREQVRRRRLVALVAIVRLSSARRRGGRGAPARASTTAAPAAASAARAEAVPRSSSPRGSRARRWRMRVHAVAKIARRKSHKPVQLNAAAYLRASQHARPALLPPAEADEPRGLPLPGDLRLPGARRPRLQLVAGPADDVLPELEPGRPELCEQART